MKDIFESTRIKKLSLANRFVRSATWEAMAAPDGACTQELTDLMVRLAEGGVGLIISGHTSVCRQGHAGPRHLAIYDDRFIPGLLKMTTAVHNAGGKIVIQIAHAGCQASREFTGQEPVGPSAFAGEKGIVCREMAVEEIRMVIDAFGQAASRAQKAGFDGIQIHAAHGYLLSEFLSPFFNKRKDAYGGSTDNRARIVREVLMSVRKRIGNNFPVMIKLNSSDFLDGGIDINGMLDIASILEKDGIDAIELSGGTAYSGENSPIRACKNETGKDNIFYLDAARRYKEKITAPLMIVGGIRSLSAAARLIRENTADYVSLSRPLIREPDLINRWKSGDTRNALCRSDNLCYTQALSGKGLYCAVEKSIESDT